MDSGWRWWGIHMGHMLNTVKAKAQPVQMLSSIIIVASHLKKKKTTAGSFASMGKVARVRIFSRQQTLLHFRTY